MQKINRLRSTVGSHVSGGILRFCISKFSVWLSFKSCSLKMAWNTKFNGLTDEQLSVILENSFGLVKVMSEPAFFSEKSSTLVFEPGEFVISTSLKGRGVKSTFTRNVSKTLQSLVLKAKNIIIPVSFDYHDKYRGIGHIENMCAHFAMLYVSGGTCTFVDTIVKDKTNIEHYKRWGNVKAKLIPALKKELKVPIFNYFFHRFKKNNYISNGCVIPIIWTIEKIISGTYSMNSNPYTSVSVLKKIYDHIINHFPEAKIVVKIDKKKK